MNVCFKTPSESLDTEFHKRAAEAGFIGLKGHRLVGGLRASIYNAMPSAGVDQLIGFMDEFRKR
jgi:phosphoserine aminotransferase